MALSGSLVQDWRQASLSSAWADAAQWWTPAVEAVADAIVDETLDLRAACEVLGRHRAAAGIFLDDAREDVKVVGLASCSFLRPAALVPARVGVARITSRGGRGYRSHIERGP